VSLAVLATVGLAAVGEIAPVARGTFPGANGLIAFTRATAAGSSIAVVEPDRSGFRILIENASEPAWSADGRSIAFVRKSTRGDWDIFIADADGSDVRQLAIPGGDEISPALSPDGSQIAFEEYRHGGRLAQIDVVNVDGSDRRQVTHDEHYYGYSPAWPEWSQDGRWILFTGATGVFARIHPNGSGRVDLDLGTDSPTGYPSWSPNGQQVAFSATDCGICVSSVDGKRVRRVSLVRGDALQPAWSPDGHEIVFTHEIITKTRTRSKYKLEADLYVINADGSGLRPLVRGKAQTSEPAWQPTPAPGP
jgi:TolB protein